MNINDTPVVPSEHGFYTARCEEHLEEGLLVARLLYLQENGIDLDRFPSDLKLGFLFSMSLGDAKEMTGYNP